MRAATRPIDPRVRAVVSTDHIKLGLVVLKLECGHVSRRKPLICRPNRIICRQC